MKRPVTVVLVGRGKSETWRGNSLVRAIYVGTRHAAELAAMPVLLEDASGYTHIALRESQ